MKEAYPSHLLPDDVAMPFFASKSQKLPRYNSLYIRVPVFPHVFPQHLLIQSLKQRAFIISRKKVIHLFEIECNLLQFVVNVVYFHLNPWRPNAERT